MFDFEESAQAPMAKPYFSALGPNGENFELAWEYDILYGIDKSTHQRTNWRILYYIVAGTSLPPLRRHPVYLP